MWALSAPSAASEPPELANIQAALHVLEHGRMPPSAVDFLWTLHSRIEQPDDLFVFLSVLTGTHADPAQVLNAVQQLEKTLRNTQHATLADQQRMSSMSDKVKSLATPLWETWLEQSTHAHLSGLLTLRCQVLRLKADCLQQPPSDQWSARRAAVSAVDGALQRLFQRWFAGARLTLRELQWSTASGQVLEQLQAAEKVHPFADLQDVKQRMHTNGSGSPNRHIFALEHSGVDGPLVAVQVALTEGIESSVDRLLQRPSPIHEKPSPTATSPNTAMFYSINSTQEALRGVDLGNTLIKQVVTRLQTAPATAGRIQCFSTLSPIPGYHAWLRTEAAKLELGPTARVFGDGSNSTKEAECLAHLREAFNGPDLTLQQAVFTMAELLSDDAPWWWDAAFAEQLRLPVLRSVAWYVTKERRRNKLLDSVANFHVSNGAQVYRLNWLANCSAKGNQESLCVMVNYLYDLPTVERNAHEYQLHHRVDVGELVKGL